MASELNEETQLGKDFKRTSRNGQRGKKATTDESTSDSVERAIEMDIPHRSKSEKVFKRTNSSNGNKGRRSTKDESTSDGLGGDTGGLDPEMPVTSKLEKIFKRTNSSNGNEGRRSTTKDEPTSDGLDPEMPVRSKSEKIFKRTNSSNGNEGRRSTTKDEPTSDGLDPEMPVTSKLEKIFKRTNSSNGNEGTRSTTKYEPTSDGLDPEMPVRSKSVISATFSNLKDHMMHSKPKKCRLLGKRGGLNVKMLHIEQKGGRYFTDLFTTLLDAGWNWVIAIFSSCYVGSWILFGLLWLAVAKSRKLYECVESVDSFAGALLLSIEIQTTIGFGGRAVTPSCPDAIIILIAQSLVGLLMSAFLLGLVFAKLARPSRRADTLLFSKNAVVAPRDGRLCLMFRVGDIRESRILNAQIRVQLFRTRHTAEGQDIPFYQQDLRCGIDWSDKGSGNNSLFLILPLTIVHVIDEESPFYEMGPEDFNAKAGFEVVAVLEGVIESTSMIVEARTSYLGDEIFWGRDFAQVLHEKCWDSNQGRYLVDFSLFHGTIPVQLPLVSAKVFYSQSQDDAEVKSIIKKARAKSRRILSRNHQEGIVKRYTELWKRKFSSISEDEEHNQRSRSPKMSSSNSTDDCNL